MKSLGIKFLLLGLFLSVSFSLFAENSSKSLTILYTGNTQASLYPVKIQGKSLGGISGRAYLVDELKAKSKDVLLVEGPGAIAGSLKDLHSVSEGLDKKRTRVYFNALKKMGYDIACLGADDFERFEFLSGWNQGSFSLLSLGPAPRGSNLKANRYISVEKAGTKIGFVIAHNDWIKQFDSLVSEMKLKEKNGIIALVVADNVDPALLSQNKSVILKQADIVFLPEASYLSVFVDKPQGLGFYDRETKTLILAPKWGGNYVSVANVDIEDNKITDANLETKPVEPKDKINPKIKSILPVCFADADCRGKDGKVCECLNPGTKKAKCSCRDKKPYELTAVIPRKCLSCNQDQIKSWMEDIFPQGVKLNTVYMDTPAGRDIINKLNVQYLPVYLLPEGIEKDKRFYAIKESMAKTDLGYWIRPEAAGVSVYVSRKRIPKKLDLFINPILDNRYIAFLVKKVQELRKQLPDWDIRIDYIVKKDQYGNVAFENAEAGSAEAVAQLCVEKYAPQASPVFMSCRFSQGYPKDILPCLTGVTDNQVEKVGMCLNNPAEVSFFLTERTKLAGELNIDKPGVVLFENQQILSISPRALTAENLKKWSSAEDSNEDKKE